MIDLGPRHMEMVKAILAAHVSHAAVWAFGSRVNGSAETYSDLDLVVVAREKLDQRVLNRLRETFEESTLPMRVDVLDWHRLNASFQELIKGCNVLVQQADSKS